MEISVCSWRRRRQEGGREGKRQEKVEENYRKKGKRRGKSEYFRESMSWEMDEIVSYYPYSFPIILWGKDVTTCGRKSRFFFVTKQQHCENPRWRRWPKLFENNLTLMLYGILVDLREFEGDFRLATESHQYATNIHFVWNGWKSTVFKGYVTR